MKKPQFLTGNMLKLLAAFSMLLDHAGLLFFPTDMGFRIAGRLAFPIFAFMIAEGCKYTRNRWRYWGMIAALAAVCQIVYFVAAGDTYLSVLVTFSLAIPVIYVLQEWRKRKTWPWAVGFAALVAAVAWLNEVLTIDYGFWGCMLPVWVAAIPGAHCVGLILGPLRGPNIRPGFPEYGRGRPPVVQPPGRAAPAVLQRHCRQAENEILLLHLLPRPSGRPPGTILAS